MAANGEAAPADRSPGRLLEEMTGLRRRARRTRQAYWFPLVVFGVIETASAPLYYRPPCGPGGDLCSGTFPVVVARAGRWLLVLDADLYPLVATLAGAGLTVWWYRRHARRVGLHTGTRGPLLAWT